VAEAPALGAELDEFVLFFFYIHRLFCWGLK
jgi:hypothetical protein